MRSLLLFTSALGLAAAAQAQTQTDPIRAELPTFTGTYSMATGEFFPGAGAAEGGTCGLGNAYNNTALGLGFFFDAANGNSIIDEGRVPSISGGGPADNYSITGFPLAYITNSVSGVDIQVTFWETGIPCADRASQGVPVADYLISGLPGSVGGGLEAQAVYIDLNGVEFNMMGDGNGIAGDADGDTFTWAFKIIGQDPMAGDVTGLFLASDPANCLEGAGTFTDTGVGCDGNGAGSGLGTLDLFLRDADGSGSTGCFWFGGYDGDGNPPYSSFYMALNTGLENDTVSGAADLGSAVGASLVGLNTCCAFTSGQTCAGFTVTQDVWYSWTAPLTTDYTFNTFGSGYDTKLAIYDDMLGCIGSNDDSGGLQSEVSFTATAGNVYLIQAGGYNGCGDLIISNTETPPDPCLSIPDDSYEDNDSNGEAAAIANGNYAGLVAHRDDDDHFSSVVCDGDTIIFDALFIDADGDLDMRLTDAQGNFLDSAGSVSDNESVQWTNTSGGSVVVIAEVFLWPNQSANCGVYELVVTGSCNIGTQYCDQNANSTGNVAQIQVGGSVIAANGQLSLSAINMPLNETGYFVWSTAAGLIDLPGAAISDGFLCLGSGKGRFNNSVLSSGPGGHFTLDGIDTTMMPQSSIGPISIMTGDTGYFQAWFRDIGGMAGNNFTDAAVVTWQ